MFCFSRQPFLINRSGAGRRRCSVLVYRYQRQSSKKSQNALVPSHGNGLANAIEQGKVFRHFAWMFRAGMIPLAPVASGRDASQLRGNSFNCSGC